MNTQKVFYSLKNDLFKVESDGEVNFFSAEAWNAFLDKHGTNPKQNGKRLSGSDSVSQEAFQHLLANTEKEDEFTTPTCQEETIKMTKQEAIDEVKKIFKGNKNFISYCEVMIASTNGFIGISSYDIQKNNYNWEKLLRLTIDTEQGFKVIFYRKGNKRYSPEKSRSTGGNKTSNIHDYIITTYVNGETENYQWDA